VQITIGLPSLGFWHDVMGVSLARAMVNFPCDVHFSVQRGCYIATNREECVKEALQMKSDYLFFVDSDMAFPPHAMGALLQHVPGKDILGGLYFEKRLPLVATVKMPSENGDGFATGNIPTPKEPFQCAATGTGFMLIDLKRLTDCMAPPFFAFSPDVRGVTQAWADGPGEDTAFCLRARKAGLSVWCDPTVPILHSGQHLYGRAHVGID
jgi:hypothetical protein